MFVLFLDGDGGTAGTSTSMLAMASYLADVCQKKTVVFSIQPGWNCMESYVLGKKKKLSRAQMFDGIGLEGLRKLLKAGVEEKKSAENCAFRCDERLDLLPGYYPEARERFLKDYIEILPKMAGYLREHYELIFCDASRAPKELKELLIGQADGIVRMFDQNLELLKHYFKRKERGYGIPEYYVFNCYDHRSRYNLNNLRYILPNLTRMNSSVIPYCTEIRDACADGELLWAVAKGSYDDASEAMKYFFRELQRTSENVLDFMERKGGRN